MESKMEKCMGVRPSASSTIRALVMLLVSVFYIGFQFQLYETVATRTKPLHIALLMN